VRADETPVKENSDHETHLSFIVGHSSGGRPVLWSADKHYSIDEQQARDEYSGQDQTQKASREEDLNSGHVNFHDFEAVVGPTPSTGEPRTGSPEFLKTWQSAKSPDHQRDSSHSSDVGRHTSSFGYSYQLHSQTKLALLCHFSIRGRNSVGWIGIRPPTV
jgi:hypothetical protein